MRIEYDYVLVVFDRIWRELEFALSSRALHMATAANNARRVLEFGLANCSTATCSG